MNMKAIFELMNTTLAEVKIRPEKIQACSLLQRSLLYSRLYPQFKYMTFIYSQPFNSIKSL